MYGFWQSFWRSTLRDKSSDSAYLHHLAMIWLLDILNGDHTTALPTPAPPPGNMAG